MKFERLKKRLDKNRPLTTVSIRFPIDVIEDLKRGGATAGFLRLSAIGARLCRPGASDRS